MAIERKPNTPYDPEHLHDPIGTDMAANEMRSPADLDSGVQANPQLAEGPASNTRIALFAVGIAIVLGIVFYGLNNSNLHQQASTVPTPANSQNSASSSPPAAPAGMRDVTPRANNAPGTTTGNASANPQANSPASTAPGGAKTNNANPGNAPAKK
jgi:hypothetical protein